MPGRPSWKSAEFALFLPFSPFSGVYEEHLGNPERRENGLFPQISSDLLKPPSLKPPFAAPQLFFGFGTLLVTFWSLFLMRSVQQTSVYPYPLGAGSARPNPKMGAPDPEPFISRAFCAERGIETMVSDHGLGRGQTMG